MLDTNFVGTFYDWFLSTNPSFEDTNNLVPILKIMRAKRLVHWQYGALERAWAWQDVREVNSKNYSRINPHLFRRIGLAIETILFASNEDFEKWISRERNFSIPFNKTGTSLPTVELMSKQEASELVQAISPAWISILILMKYQDLKIDQVPLEKLLEMFLNWRGETRATGAPDTSEVRLIGELFFFGGSISGMYHSENYLNSPLNLGEYTAQRLLKMNTWVVSGKVKVARNISFDLSILQQQHLFRFGLKQGETEILRVKPEKLAIVTGDKGIAAISQQFMKASQTPIGFPARSHKHPPNSRFLKERQLDDLVQLNPFPFRVPEDLPRRDKLNKVLESLIDAVINHPK